jgi:hypothetical protein
VIDYSTHNYRSVIEHSTYNYLTQIENSKADRSSWNRYNPYDFKFNIDRWAAYTLQKLHSQGRYYKSIDSYYGDWAKTTPRQKRRMMKKYRKNQDTSVFMGIWHRD